MRDRERTADDAASRPRTRRKLLVATVGLAAISMVGAGCSSGNLVSPDVGDRADAGTDAAAGAADDSGSSE